MGIAESLEELTRKLGLYRGNLIEDLNGNLRELQRFWGIDLSKGRDFARRNIAQILNSYLAQIEPLPANGLTPDQAKKQYDFNVLISFNALEDPRFGLLPEMPLSDRRAWLEREAPKLNRIKIRTGQRKLKHAIGEIERLMLAAGPAPLVPDSTPTTDNFELDSQNVEPAAALVNTEVSTLRLLRRHLWTTALVLTAFVVFLAGGIVYELHQNSQPTSAPAASIDPPKLTITVLSAVDGEGGSSVVFPSATSPAAKSYLAMANITKAPTLGTPPSLFLGELKAGAYALGGLDLTFNLESTSASTITVYDIRPVFKTRTAPLAGAAIYWPGQGGYTSAQMYFDMDDLTPVAKSLSLPLKVGNPYFTTHAITVAKNNTEEVEAYLETYEGTDTFDLAVDYELNGKKYTQTFGLDGIAHKVPFAITADQCGNNDPETGAVVKPSQGGAYQAARKVDLDPSSGGKLLDVTPPGSCTDR